MGSSQDIQREAQALSDYLLDEKPTPLALALYAEALSAHPISLTKPELRLWNLGLSYPFLLPFIDAGLGLHNKNGAIRKRIFLFLCVAETIPEWSPYFLPQKSGKLQTVFKLVQLAFRSVFHSALGFFLVKWIL